MGKTSECMSAKIEDKFVVVAFIGLTTGEGDYEKQEEYIFLRIWVGLVGGTNNNLNVPRGTSPNFKTSLRR